MDLSAQGYDVTAATVGPTTQQPEGGEWSLLQTSGNMRSLASLVVVVTAASLYLYSLSLYLPAGPRRRPQPGAKADHAEEKESELLGETSEEPSR